MARTAWPTVLTGDAWSASQHNTYGRDNDAAYWVFTTAGDLAYATSSNTLARLAIGANGSILASNGSAPYWATGGLKGMLNAKGQADFAPSQTFASTWADVTGATLTLSLGVACTVMAFASVTGNNTLAGSGRSFSIRAVVDGTADANQANIANGSSNPTRLEDLMYIYTQTGVPSGSRVVKLQCQRDSGVNESNFLASGRLVALAFVE